MKTDQIVGHIQIMGRRVEHLETENEILKSLLWRVYLTGNTKLFEGELPENWKEATFALDGKLEKDGKITNKTLKMYGL